MIGRKAKRLIALSDALSERRVLHLKDAARILGVSEMTVRRDIAGTQDQFAYLGGHIVHSASFEGDAPYELAKAADKHAAAKRAACAHAVKYVHPDETVFVDCGTTLIHLIDLIPDDFPITAVCYALNVAEKLARKPNITLIMLGGLFHESSASFSGNSGIETLGHLGINTAFISAAGVDLKRGATCAHFHEAPVKHKAITLAKKSILVVDKSKIGKLKPAFFAEMGAFESIITEDGEMPLTPAG